MLVNRARGNSRSPKSAPLARSRAAERYHESAASFRQRASAVTDDPQLRDSYLSVAIQYDRLADLLEGKHRPSFLAPIPSGSDAEVVEQSAADYVRQQGPGAVEHLRDLASAAEANGDRLSASSWRDIADAAERILANARKDENDGG